MAGVASYDVKLDNYNNLYVVGFDHNFIPYPYFDYTYIIRFNSVHELEWETRHGGSSVDYIRDICIDKNNDLIIVGETRSDNFPVKPYGNAFFRDTLSQANQYDAFISKFSNDSLVWSTYFGGSADDIATSITTDSLGNYYVVGQTNSNDFPTYSNNPIAFFDSTYNDGNDGFLAKFNNLGEEQLITYYGGEDWDYFSDIFIDNNQLIFVTGSSSSDNIPFANPNMSNIYIQEYNNGDTDGILLALNEDLELVWSSYFGGSTYDGITSLTITNNNKLFIVGPTYSNSNFPIKESDENQSAYFQDSLINQDGFISKFDLSVFTEIKSIENNKKNIIIFPNPTDNNINIKSNEKFDNYTIYNSVGQIVQNGILQSAISVYSLPIGIYIVYLTNDTNSYYFKFIKK